jgi:DNA-binding IclR family transcriptional regulator
VAALALGGPTPRFTDADVARFAPAVVAAAQEISKLGFGPRA